MTILIIKLTFHKNFYQPNKRGENEYKTTRSHIPKHNIQTPECCLKVAKESSTTGLTPHLNLKKGLIEKNYRHILVDIK